MSPWCQRRKQTSSFFFFNKNSYNLGMLNDHSLTNAAWDSWEWIKRVLLGLSVFLFYTLLYFPQNLEPYFTLQTRFANQPAMNSQVRFRSSVTSVLHWMSLETDGIFVDRGPKKFTVKLRGSGAVTCTVTKLCIDTLIAAITTPLPK